MSHKFQLMAVLTFGVAMLFIENQIQKLEDSRARLGKTRVLLSSTSFSAGFFNHCYNCLYGHPQLDVEQCLI